MLTATSNEILEALTNTLGLPIDLHLKLRQAQELVCIVCNDNDYLKAKFQYIPW